MKYLENARKEKKHGNKWWKTILFKY
jgi:hypothetical protein